MTDADDREEDPLDPAMERVRRKLVRLLMVSTSIMIVGLSAVFAGIFYRLSEMGDDAADEKGPIALPLAASDIGSASVNADSLVLVLRGREPRIEIRRLDDGALVRSFLLEPQGTGGDRTAASR